MKRYWLPVSLALLAISAPFVYYGLGVGNQLPEFKLETRSGDASEASGLTISAALNNHWHYNSLITVGGTEYPFEKQTKLSDLYGAYYYMLQNGDTRRLMQEHRSFIRGKNKPGGFFQNDDLLIYADVAPYESKAEFHAKASFQIDYLDKRTGEKEAFNLISDTASSYHSIYIEDVQWIEGALYMFASLWDYGFTTKEVYRLDLATKELTLQRKLANPEMIESDKRIEMIARSADTVSEASPFLLLTMYEEQAGRTEEIDPSGTASDTRQSYYYAYQTDELIRLPAEMEERMEQSGGLSSLQGDEYYSVKFGSTGLQLSRYRMGEPSADIDYATLSASELGAELIQNVKIMNDRVYVLFVKNGAHSIAVCRLDTLERLYEGEVTQTGKHAMSPQKLQEHFKLIDVFQERSVWPG